MLRNIGSAAHQKRLDPFLLLDEFKSDQADDYIGGFPEHPHRGFETVTYMLAGALRHRDSVGNVGHLRAGDVQWMSAASGILHEEMPEQTDGLMWGFQLWVNLPAEHKLDPPHYTDIPADQIPQIEAALGVKVKIIAGTYQDVTGPASSLGDTPLFLDVHIDPGSTWLHEIAAGLNSFVYVYEGVATVEQSGEAAEISSQQLVVLKNKNGESGELKLTADQSVVRCLLLAGRPYREPIVQYGPFVMNNRKEIDQALEDYANKQLVFNTDN